MTCGLDLGILLICLVQAELVCCSRAKEALRPQNSNTYAGFSPPDIKPSKFSRHLQDQFREGFSSPRSVQSSTFNSNPAVNSSSGLRPSTRRYTPLSWPAQSSRRLGQSSMVINPTWKKTSSQKSNTQSVPKQSFAPSSSVGRASVSQLSENKKEHLERKVTLAAQQGTWGSPRERFSFRLQNRNLPTKGTQPHPPLVWSSCSWPTQKLSADANICPSPCKKIIFRSSI
ncbi:hypothetical protein ATANTOWER_009797 [Ataeniobius toweri]|uniref:Uncharacterized protein n=1 Tax=Ataeniobius toweri TaxID=208326 RepID=A0ABU7BHT4_9TELE|nr:hypothetical protein [Ataeniobius toweri]